MKTKTVLVALSLLGFGASTSTSLQAAGGGLDPSFGNAGWVGTNYSDVSTTSERAYAVVKDGADRLLVAGDGALARYFADGTLDTAFNADVGAVNLSITARDVLVDSAGRYVVAGNVFSGSDTTWDFALARYLSDGSLDTTFGAGGRVITDFASEPDMASTIIEVGGGGYLVAGFAVNGSYEMALARYNADGTLDTSFGVGGKVTTDFAGSSDYAHSLVELSSGAYLVAGVAGDGTFYDIALARYNIDGTLDNSFDGDGKVVTSISTGSDFANSVIELSSGGGYLVAGRDSADDFVLLRYLENGALDTSFDTDGWVSTDFSGGDDVAAAVIELSGGDYLAAGTAFNGTTNDFALARYNADGSLDTSFDSDGKAVSDLGGRRESASAVIELSAGDYFVVGAANDANGYSDFALARYSSNGSLNAEFGNAGVVVTSFGGGDDTGSSVLELGGGGYLVAGSAYNGTNRDFALARYRLDGTLDTAFGMDGKVLTDFAGYWDYGHSVLELAGGGYLVAGTGQSSSNANRVALARYTSDGILDVNFGSGGKVLTNVAGGQNWSQSAVELSDGGYLVAGYGSSSGVIGAPTDLILARYNPDGTLDPSFDTDGKVVTDLGGTDRAHSVIELSSGGYLVAGSSYLVDNYDFALVRYNLDGTPDTTFGTDGKVFTDFFGDFDSANSVIELGNGGYLVAGSASKGTDSDFALASYRSDGTLDTSFGNGGLLVVDFAGEGDGASTVIELGDGGFLVAGGAQVSGSTDVALARLTPDGSLDTAFGSGGLLISDIAGGSDQASSVIELNPGEYMVAGSTESTFDSDILLAKYHDGRPTLGGMVAGQAVDDSNTLQPFSGVTLSDPDGDTVTVTVTLDTAAKGAFTTLNGFLDAGSGVYTLAATLPASATSAIQGLVFDPADNRVLQGSTETTTFTVEVSDGTATVSDTTTTVVATSINDLPSNDIVPVISGTASVGSTLTTTDGSWSDVDGDSLSYSYQWQADGIAITGATESSYTPTTANASAEITVIVTANDGHGGESSASATAVVLDADTDWDGYGDTTDDFPDYSNEWVDSDGDGVGDNGDAFPNDASESADSDGDGVGDNGDAFPNDADETVDTDSDGIGDNTDTDDDGDGIPDTYESLRGLNPLDAADADLDLDADGYSNIVEYLFGSELGDIESTPGISLTDADSDGDGVPDSVDAFPSDPDEYIDTDGDGIGNNADGDDDEDGIADSLDEMPLDANETLDSDGDGAGDNTDAFINDPTEWLDTDGDDIGNNTDPDDDGDGVNDGADEFPLDGTEWVDSDGDGVGDNGDVFPNDPAEWADTDGDGLGDNADIDADGDGVDDNQDAFPLDATEWLDSDGDEVGDNSDLFPTDPSESADNDADGIGDNADTDDDNDGVADSEDAFPLDATESVDTDGDGIGNNADTDDDGDGVEDVNDAYPLDASRSEASSSGGGGATTLLSLVVGGLLLWRRRLIERGKVVSHHGRYDA